MLLPNKKMKFWKNGLGTVQLLSNYDKPTHFRVPNAAEGLKHLTFSTALQKVIYDYVGKSRICTLTQSSNENGRSKESTPHAKPQAMALPFSLLEFTQRSSKYLTTSLKNILENPSMRVQSFLDSAEALLLPGPCRPTPGDENVITPRFIVPRMAN